MDKKSEEEVEVEVVEEVEEVEGEEFWYLITRLASSKVAGPSPSATTKMTLFRSEFCETPFFDKATTRSTIAINNKTIRMTKTKRTTKRDQLEEEGPGALVVVVVMVVVKTSVVGDNPSRKEVVEVVTTCSVSESDISIRLL
eukprot:Lithocolla_globosa_v1_NODE_2118_length_2157_cov_15.331113.p2 type:complete len:142 gc:universal NODE_2118_length_2157_cov_15.331113:467-42(-)